MLPQMFSRYNNRFMQKDNTVLKLTKPQRECGDSWRYHPDNHFCGKIVVAFQAFLSPLNTLQITFLHLLHFVLFLFIYLYYNIYSFNTYMIVSFTYTNEGMMMIYFSNYFTNFPYTLCTFSCSWIYLSFCFCVLDYCVTRKWLKYTLI